MPLRAGSITGMTVPRDAENPSMPALVQQLRPDAALRDVVACIADVQDSSRYLPSVIDSMLNFQRRHIRGIQYTVRRQFGKGRFCKCCGAPDLLPHDSAGEAAASVHCGRKRKELFMRKIDFLLMRQSSAFPVGQARVREQV